MNRDEAQSPTRRHWMLAAMSLAGLSACGGAGDGTAEPQADEGRKRPLGVDSGGTGSPYAAFMSAAIDAVGPLVVGGVAIDASQGQLYDAEGRPLALSDLAPGMTSQVTLEPGSPAAPVARTLRVAEQLRGPLATLDVAARTLAVLGQRVAITSRTVFGAGLAQGLLSMFPGHLLRIWGQLDIAGARIVATRIEIAGADPWVVRGVLDSIDRTTGRITLGALSVTADDPALLPEGLSAGDVVRAQLAQRPDGSGLALRALRDDALRLPEGVRAEIEGRITRLRSALHFDIDGIEVDASGATLEVQATSLVLGARAQAAGRSANGRLLATSVEIESDEIEPYELEGTIATANASARTFVVRGISVSWDASTRIVGGSAQLIAARRKVSVKGRISRDRTRLAAQLIHVES